MFTGIVEELGVVEKLEKSKVPSVLTIRAEKILEGLKKGDSVSVNGVCLTVVGVGKDRFLVETIEETLAKTNLKDIRQGKKVNLEGALKAGGKISGHFVTGHVDGVGTLVKKEERKEEILIEVKAAQEILNGIVYKGSIAVDGISLTVAETSPNSFSVYIIPHTAKVTTLGFKGVGEEVNLEIDILGKFVKKFSNQNKPSKITEEFLREKGLI
ncbi:MAG: hypothetical protein AMJ78_05165 [Omnitrophica WOR_2 bacterium SM23_29]|nr:MAG: hypothetical protein AMJ78_05165 [Omnitrophica WOR_2 bacterium SM23_29]